MDAEAPSLWTHRALIFVACAVVLACLFDYLFMWKVPGISVPIFTTSIGISLVALTALFRRKMPRDVALLLLLALFFSAMTAVRANVLEQYRNTAGNQ